MSIMQVVNGRTEVRSACFCCLKGGVQASVSLSSTLAAEQERRNIVQIRSLVAISRATSPRHRHPQETRLSYLSGDAEPSPTVVLRKRTPLLLASLENP